MGELRRYYLRCSHDDDNDFLETEDATGTWCKAADVDAELKRRRSFYDSRDGGLQRENASLREQLEQKDAELVNCLSSNIQEIQYTQIEELKAELARVNEIGEEQRRREHRLVETVQALRTELAQATAAVDEVTKREAAIIKKLETERDRAEAACAEMATDIRSIMSNPLLDTLAWRELNKVMGNPNPGSRYLELAKLVEYLVPAIEQSLEEQPLVPHDADAPSGNVTITWRTGRDVAEAILRWKAGQP